MLTKEDKFTDYLKFKGLKFTPQRQLILEEVFSLHKHFDVDQLYEKLRKKGKYLSQATIYRTLPLLVESNLIKETLHCQGKTGRKPLSLAPGKVSYEHIFGHDHHDHMVCIKCGKIIEFKEEKIERLQEEVCQRFGFKPVEHRLGIRGYCQKCYETTGEHRLNPKSQ